MLTAPTSLPVALALPLKQNIGEVTAGAGQVDFYAVARARGIGVLRERCGEDISARTIAALIDTVLDILQQVVRAELN
jgi:hypothetical protein